MAKRKEKTKIKPDPKNARQRTDRNRAAIARSLDEFGPARSIVIDGHGTVRAGNGTLEAAQAAGIPIRVVKGSRGELIAIQRDDWTEDEATAYAIADNRSADLAEWNLDQLQESLGGLSERLAGSVGFNAKDLRELFPPQVTEDENPIDQAAELQKKWKVRRGQRWKISGKRDHWLVCGDASDPKRWESCELVVTSPPYPGADMWNEGAEQTKRDNAQRLYDLGWEVLDLATKHAEVVAWNVGDCSTGQAEMLPTGALVIQWAREREMLTRWCIWDKGITNPLPPQSFMRRPVVQHITHEWIVVIYPNGWKPREKTCGMDTGTHEWQMRSVWTIAPEHATRLGHKAPFPVRLAERCIALWSLEGDRVVDPFLGSGTTMAAAEQLGRSCYGLEIEPRYCAVILERMTALGCECSPARS